MEEAAEKPPTTSEKTNKPYRGKKSSQKHNDKFRVKVGQQIVKANNARLDSNLFSNLSSISNRLQAFASETQKLAASLSMTTRGIGLSVQQSSNWANQIKPTLNLDPFVLYRCSLAQHHYSMHKSSDFLSTYRPTAPFQNFDLETFLGFHSIIESESNSHTFTPIVTVLSNFGKLNVNNGVYKGFVPVNNVTYRVNAREEQPSAEPSRKKGKSSYITHIISLESI